ncbi:putative repeat protein (TIGR01451 family) [Actinoplanes tereljensis]|uniref:DUF11 domain-containing protein n=1 Tax=Paractinoplanes tereljensis TaxID=571912 RepID=A0A919TXF0_9ACTN|nr:Ig-like domain-containing protein [Actinoplanes tereljensis]GIF24155.1 hypothetical protein Ate02nite_68850 [Actinoplanes tereljensis]
MRRAAAALAVAVALLLAATTFATQPAVAAITTPFTSRFETNANGSILLRGNSNMTCTLSVACAAAQNGSGSSLNNNNFAMVYTDADGSLATFNDSTATITMPAGSTVLFAGLYWGADSTLALTPGSRNQVKFRTPAATWATVTASTVHALPASGVYQGFADVTGLVAGAGNGVYGVANIQATLATGQYAGWGLAIAYTNPAEDMRSLRIYDGFGSISSGSVNIPISGFETPHSGTVHAKVGAIAYEGDLGNVGDSLQVDGQALHDANNLNPANNFFNSTVSDSGMAVTTRDPPYPNLLGVDIDQVDATGMFTNGQLSTTLTLTTVGDTYYPGVVTFSIDLYAPKITTTVTGTDLDGGDLLPGDVLEYRIAVRNDGSDTADNLLLSDAVPPHTTYVPGSLTVQGAPVTDANGDDDGWFTGGTANWNLGSIPYLATKYVTFRVTVDVSTPAGYAITNLVNVAYSGHTTSVSVAALGGSVATPVLQPHVDRSAALTLSPSFVQRAATPTTATYTATVSNAPGSDLEPAARALLTLPTGVTPGTLTGGCTAAGAVVTCPLGPLAGGTSASVPIPVIVDSTAADSAVASLVAAGSGADPTAGNDTAIVALAVNSPPVAVADTGATTNGSQVTVPVLANDSDPDDATGTLTVSIVSGPAHGAAVVNADMTVTYTPAGGWAGADPFVYRVTDPHGGTDTATATVTTANAAPTANDDMINTPSNTPVTITVLDNDSDPNPPDTLTVVAVTQPPAAAGTVTFTPTTVTFTPTSSYAGTALFGYTVDDGHGATASADVHVDVENADPTAADDTLSAPAGASGTSLPVLANDTDPNGNNTLTVTAAGPAAHGTVTPAADGLSVLYTAVPAGFSGTDTFTYTIDDGSGGTDTATVTVTVANTPPTAADFPVNTPYRTAVTLDPVHWATDPNPDTIQVTGVTDPAHGVVTLETTGKITYLPDVAYSGTDTFTYTIDDGSGGTDTGTVTVTVANGVPVARPDAATAAGGHPVVIAVLANDDEPSDHAMTFAVDAPPSNGSYSIGPDRRITYTPAAGFAGTDSFHYLLDGVSGATVTITMVNTAPTARPDSVSTDTNTAVVIPALANDDDPNGDLVTLDVVGTGGHGTVTDNGDRTFTYTPATGFFGTDAFLYSIRDPLGLTDSAIVTVTVRNAPPVAVDDAFRVRPNVSTRLDLLANDTDPNTGQHLRIASVGTVAKGTLTLATDGTVTYRATVGQIGPDGFSYLLIDDRGSTDSGDVTITIDGGPTAVDDTATTPYATPVDIPVLANDSDPEARPLRITAVSAGIRINPDGTVRYTPPTGYSGVAYFGYTISDPIGNTASAQVSVVVANAAPRARPDQGAGLADRPVTVDVLANDDDPNLGQTLTIDAVGTPANGTAGVVAGQVRFVPKTGWIGQDVFSYRINDGHGGTATSTITVTISDGSPVAVADRADTPYRKPVTVDVLGNDFDPAGSLALSSVTQPASGTASIAGDNVTYTPPEGFGGVASFAYTAADDAGHRTSAAVTVTVGAPPTVPDKSAVAKPGGSVSVPLPQTDEGGRSVIVRWVGKPPHGTAVLNPDGTVTYTPDPGFVGVDTFTYEVVDADGNVATASVIVTVTDPPVANQPPVAAADTVTMAAGESVELRPTINDRDPDGDPVTIVKLGKPTGGTVAAGPGDTVLYHAAGAGRARFSYTIADGRGGLATATVTVNVRTLDTLPITGSDALVLARAGLIAVATGGFIYWAGLPRPKGAQQVDN